MSEEARKVSFWMPATEFVRRLPSDMPLIALLGSDRFQMVVTKFSPADALSFGRQTWRCEPTRNEGLPFQRGYIGALAYDDFVDQQGNLSLSKIYRVEQGFVFDQVNQHCWQVGDDFDQIELDLQPPFPLDESPWHISQCNSWTQYINDAHEVIEEIRSGRFYQMNLLRFFDVDLTLETAVWRRRAISRLARWGGPMSCLFATGDFDLISFSPERFLSVTPTPKGLGAMVNPIKGTSARSIDPHLDQKAAATLQGSKKELAELHMIVDLMRNDLSAVSERGTVEVEAASQLRSFASVHHLEAVVTSVIRQDLSMQKIFAALCPAGSITGAPKREVMSAIFQREKRGRRFFMGNVFYLDDRGYFDSSVLIRTLERQPSGWQYAAGSGLTVRSDPEVEAAEIQTKCQVLTAPP